MKSLVLVFVFLFWGCATTIPIVAPPLVRVVSDPQLIPIQPSAVELENFSPLKGKIVFRGLRTPFRSVAEVSLDGKNLGKINEGGYIPVVLSELGSHMVKAKIYYVADGAKRGQLIGSFSREFIVSPRYRYGGRGEVEYWWVVEIH